MRFPYARRDTPQEQIQAGKTPPRNLRVDPRQQGNRLQTHAQDRTFDRRRCPFFYLRARSPGNSAPRSGEAAAVEGGDLALVFAAGLLSEGATGAAGWRKAKNGRSASW